MRRGEPKNLGFLRERPFAHRGLHAPEVAVENSFAAFDRAIAAGLGIELDVRLTADKGVAVFHDAELRRLTGAPGRVADLTLAELFAIKLAGTDEPVRSLRDAIVHIGGRVPLLIEVKTPGRRGIGSLCRAVRRAIEGANGWAAVMSFDARVGCWFREHSPQTVRGLVITESDGPETRGVRGWFRRAVALSRARPHFLAYDIRSLPTPTSERFRATGRPVLTWTVRSDADRARAAAHSDQIIFEQAADSRA